jgi:hypothetical protein
MFRAAIFGLAMAGMIEAAYAAAASQGYSCDENVIEPTGLAPSPKTVRLVLNSANKVSIDLGQSERCERQQGPAKVQYQGFCR